MNTPTLADFNKENRARPFVVFDRTVNEFWSGGGFTKDINKATIYRNGFDKQEEVDAAYNNCSLRFV